MKIYAPLVAIATIALIIAPSFVLSMAAATATFGTIAFAGAWLVDRYGSLPGGDRRCA